MTTLMESLFEQENSYEEISACRMECKNSCHGACSGTCKGAHKAIIANELNKI